MEITKAVFLTSAVNNEGIPNENHLPEFMFCGRSNVGKSSFINALVRQKNLARTSQNPGKTQTLNIFLCNDNFILVDVPGYGYARVSKAMKEKFGKMIEEYVTSRNELKMAFLLVDFRHKPTEDDVLMYNFLKYYEIPVTIIATKSDKVKNKDRKNNKELIKETLNLKAEDKFIVTSSEKNEGIPLVRAEIEKNLVNNEE